MPDKDYQRAMLENAIAEAELDGVTVKRLPMVAALRCRTCGHRGTARVPPGATPRFKCSACGSSLVAWQV